MSESLELRTVQKCSSQLETALKGQDRELVHFLKEEGIITACVHDTILNPVSLFSEAEKAGELVKWIENRVKQDPQSFYVLLQRFKQGGNVYQPIVRKLEAKYVHLAATTAADQESLSRALQQQCRVIDTDSSPIPSPPGNRSLPHSSPPLRTMESFQGTGHSQHSNCSTFGSKDQLLPGQISTNPAILGVIQPAIATQPANMYPQTTNEGSIAQTSNMKQESTTDPDTNSSQMCSDLSSLNPDILKDLKFKLRLNLREIIKRYGSYVDCIRVSIINKGISANDLCTYLLTLSAFNHHEKQDMLLSSSKLQLEAAAEVNDIFKLLITAYASFLNYGIFQTLLEKYNVDEGQKELRYPEHLKAYVEKHKISEFIEIKPSVMGRITANSQKMVLIFDIQQTCRLAKLMELENDIADILGLTPLGLRLLDVEKGCVVLTVLIPTSIARIIFSGNKLSEAFTPDQIRRFQALKLHCLKFDNQEWDFSVPLHDNDVNRATPNSTTTPYQEELLLQGQELSRDQGKSNCPPTLPQAQPTETTESSIDSVAISKWKLTGLHHVSIALQGGNQFTQLECSSTQMQYRQMDSGIDDDRKGLTDSAIEDDKEGYSSATSSIMIDDASEGSSASNLTQNSGFTTDDADAEDDGPPPSNAVPDDDEIRIHLSPLPKLHTHFLAPCSTNRERTAECERDAYPSKVGSRTAAQDRTDSGIDVGTKPRKLPIGHEVGPDTPGITPPTNPPPFKVESPSRKTVPRHPKYKVELCSSMMRYKTELCRPFQENGFCKYGDKCQFSHGEHDLRCLPQNPKYKTELCDNYHTRGFCPHGIRCHFIHSIDETRNLENCTPLPKSPTKKTFSFSTRLSRYQKESEMHKDLFKTVKPLGIGAFGVVSLVRKSDTNKLYAMKTLSIANVLQRNQVKAERDILAEADNEWVVKLFFSFQDSENLYFVMEYIPGGDMMRLLIKLGTFPEHLALFYVAELVCAIESVHKMGFIHQDIKPDNILIGSDGHIKLTNFGFCTGFRWTQHSKRYLLKGPHQRHPDYKEPVKPLEVRRRQEHDRSIAHSLVNYIAPEILRRVGYKQLCDWWSVGVIMYKMIVGQPPFMAPTPSETQHKIMNWSQYMHIPRHAVMSRAAADLILRFCCDPSDRIGKNGAMEIKSHPFFSAIDWSIGIRNYEPPYVPKIMYDTDTSNFDPISQSQLQKLLSKKLKQHDVSSLPKGQPKHASYEWTFIRFYPEKGHGQKRPQITPSSVYTGSPGSSPAATRRTYSPPPPLSGSQGRVAGRSAPPVTTSNTSSTSPGTGRDRPGTCSPPPPLSGYERPQGRVAGCPAPPVTTSNTSSTSPGTGRDRRGCSPPPPLSGYERPQGRQATLPLL